MQVKRERERRPSLQVSGWGISPEHSVTRVEQKPLWSRTRSSEGTCTRVSEGVFHTLVLSSIHDQKGCSRIWLCCT